MVSRRWPPPPSVPHPAFTAQCPSLSILCPSVSPLYLLYIPHGAEK